MASVARRPFAPLDRARLQTLTSAKNTQNALTNNSNITSKRKASEIDFDNLDFDCENVDPLLVSKRSRENPSDSNTSTDLDKPWYYMLTKQFSRPLNFSPAVLPSKTISHSKKLDHHKNKVSAQPRPCAPRLNSASARPLQSHILAGRSPVSNSKRLGISSKRSRTEVLLTRAAEFACPKFSVAPVPFSLDAALKGTIPSYAGISTPVSKATKSPTAGVLASEKSNSSRPEVHLDALKPSWVFDIHEDTHDQELTNLLQHSTCVLEISSDEENEQKIRREHAEGRDKENVPPVDDASQTTVPRAPNSLHPTRTLQKPSSGDSRPRGPLTEMNLVDYYPAHCDPAEVFIIPGDEGFGGPEAPKQSIEHLSSSSNTGLSLEASTSPSELLSTDSIVKDALASGRVGEDLTSKVPRLEPIEGYGGSFELWESSSTQDATEDIQRSSLLGM